MPDSNIRCLARPDHWDLAQGASRLHPTASGDYSDLKTTESVKASRRAARDRSRIWLRLHMQGALVLEARLRSTWRSFLLARVGRKEAPFCTRVSTLDDEDIARGAGCNRIALRVSSVALREVLARPGDEEDASFLRMSEAARLRIDERLLKEAA